MMIIKNTDGEMISVDCSSGKDYTVRCTGHIRNDKIIVTDCEVIEERTIDACSCDLTFPQLKAWGLTMKGMKGVATKYFTPQPFNKWVCKKCGKEHVKDW